MEKTRKELKQAQTTQKHAREHALACDPTLPFKARRGALRPPDQLLQPPAAASLLRSCSRGCVQSPGFGGRGEKFPQRQAWISERRCLPPTAQTRRPLCGFADFLHSSLSSSSGLEGDFWARECSHRSPGFSTSCLFVVSKEAWSGKAHQRLFPPTNLHTSCFTVNFSVCGIDPASFHPLYLLIWWSSHGDQSNICCHCGNESGSEQPWPSIRQVLQFRQLLRSNTHGCAKIKRWFYAFQWLNGIFFQSSNQNKHETRM